MNVAKYIIDLFPNEEEQLEKFLEYKEYLHLNIHKEDCGCVFYIIEKEGIEPLYVYLNVCIPHKFTNKLLIEEIQIRHRRSLFKPLIWEN